MQGKIIDREKEMLIENCVVFSNRGSADYTRKEELTYSKLKETNPRYVFFPFWSWFIPPEIYENFECVIFHMTDLPYGRGGSPLQNLIVTGHTETKISALRCVKELDAGPVYIKRDLDISIGSANDIYDMAYRIIMDDMIPCIIKNNPKPKKQQGKVVTFERWGKCAPQDIARVLDTKYEGICDKEMA